MSRYTCDGDVELTVSAYCVSGAYNLGSWIFGSRVLHHRCELSIRMIAESSQSGGRRGKVEIAIHVSSLKWISIARVMTCLCPRLIASRSPYFGLVFSQIYPKAQACWVLPMSHSHTSMESTYLERLMHSKLMFWSLIRTSSLSTDKIVYAYTLVPIVPWYIFTG